MQSQRNTTNNVISEKNVLWLDVAMNHMHLVTVVNRSGNTTDIRRCSSLTESLALQQVFVDFALRRVLQDHIHTLLVPKVAVHAQNVLVFQMGLDFNFTPNLLLDATPLQFTLLNHLDGHNELGFDLTGEIYATYRVTYRNRELPKRPFPIFFPISKSANAHSLFVMTLDIESLLGVTESAKFRLQLLHFGSRHFTLLVIQLDVTPGNRNRVQDSSLLFSILRNGITGVSSVFGKGSGRKMEVGGMSDGSTCMCVCVRRFWKDRDDRVFPLRSTWWVVGRDCRLKERYMA